MFCEALLCVIAIGWRGLAIRALKIHSIRIVFDPEMEFI